MHGRDGGCDALGGGTGTSEDRKSFNRLSEQVSHTSLKMG